MKVYVAARFSKRETVKKVYKLLKDKGHEITADWTVHQPIKPYDQHAEKAKEYAVEDINGVIDCDLFILLTSETPGAGSAGELGAAIALNTKFNKPKVYVVGEHLDNNFFYYHPAVIRKNSIEEVLQEL